MRTPGIVTQVQAAGVPRGDGRDVDISVVVPTRNRAVLVERLLRQLLSIDDGLEYEIVVIDEGSSDSTPALLAQLAADHGIIVVRHDEPRASRAPETRA